MKKVLEQAVAASGSQTACAKEFGVSTAYINDCLRGRRDIGKSIAAALGYRPMTIYVPLKENGGR